MYSLQVVKGGLGIDRTRRIDYEGKKYSLIIFRNRAFFRNINSIEKLSFRIFALLEQEIYEEYDSSITHQWWFDGIISPGDDERRRGREYGPVVEAVPQRRRRGSEVDDDDEAGSSCSICGI